MNAPKMLALVLQEANPPEEAPPGGGPPSMLILYVLIFLVIYFVAIRPGSKEKKRREQLLGALKKGDRVMTTSGMFGSVTQVQGDVVTLQVADGVRLRFSRQAVQQVLNEEAEEEGEAKK